MKHRQTATGRSRTGGAYPLDRLGAVLALLCGLTACGPRGVDRVEITQPEEHWFQEGWVLLEPPIHLPSSNETLDQVTVFMRLPADGVIETILTDEAPSGHALSFPPGTRVDRVEWVGSTQDRFVVDVRGATIELDRTQSFHVYRRTGPERGSPLFGFRWPRDDAKAHDAATSALLEVAAETPAFARLPAPSRKAGLEDLRQKNQCLRCHGTDEPPAEHADQRIVLRGTDHNGYYVPQTVLRDEAPLEPYGSFDLNLEDPHIEITCPSGVLERQPGPAGGARARCSDGSIPEGRYALMDALAEDDPRAQRVCTARLFLFSHLDALGREVFGDAIRPCQDAVARAADPDFL